VRGDWKYLLIEGVEYLFNVARDPRERANLRDREPERLAELRQAWTAWDASLPPIPEEAKVSLVFTRQDLPSATF
jgi:arylsulfatase A-like enzyme